MVEWVIQNKEWLFSGIGVFVLSGALLFYRYFLSSKRNPAQPNLPELIWTQTDALWSAKMTTLLESAHPKTAYLIEYSSASIRQVIDLALEHNWTVKLLVRDPETPTPEWQRNKIQLSVYYLKRDLAEAIADKKLQIFYYSVPGSIRLRYFEEMSITLGWYTYDHREGFGDDQIFGHNNPTLSILPNHPSWHDAKDFVLGIFSRMERHCRKDT